MESMKLHKINLLLNLVNESMKLHQINLHLNLTNGQWIPPLFEIRGPFLATSRGDHHTLSSKSKN